MTIQEEQVTSSSRRDFIKISGVASVGLFYSSPVVEALRPKSCFTTYSSSFSSQHSRRRPQKPQESQVVNTSQQLSGQI